MQLTRQVTTISEGHKRLMSLACVVLQPAVLDMDKPTIHNSAKAVSQLPAVAKAVSQLSGAIMLVSHATHFVKQVNLD